MTTLDPIEEMIGMPLEKMRGGHLARYITYYHLEANGIHLVDPPGQIEVSALNGFKRHYGADRSAAIFRFLFLEKGGTYDVWGETQTIEHRHFQSNMRRWMNKIDIELQKRSLVRQADEDDDDLVFATEL